MRLARTSSVVLLLIAFALASRTGSAATPPPADTLRLTLDDAVKRALAEGPDARTARANVNLAEGQVHTATAEALPQITGSLTYDRRFASAFQNLASDTLFGPLFAHSSFAAVNNWTADLTATQTLWTWGRVGAGMAAARSVRRSALATRAEAYADVALAVRTAYLEAQYAYEVQAIADEGLAQSRAHLHDVELQKSQGSRSEYELLQAEVDAANAEPNAVNARDAAHQALLRLRTLLALPLSQPLVLATPLRFEDGQVPMLAAEPADGATRPAIESAEAMVLARRQALRAERASRWPKLLASGTVSHQAFPTDIWPARHDFVAAVDGSLRLEWPLFQGFKSFGNIEQAGAQLRAAEADRDRTRDAVALDVAQAREDVRRMQSTLAARRGTSSLAQRTYHLATVRWHNGLSTQLEVSDSRLQMLTAEVNEVAATKDYRLALLRLERATGKPLALATTSYDQLSPSTPADEVH